MGFDQSNIDDLLREAGLGSGGGASGGGGGQSVDSILGSAGGGGAKGGGASPAKFESFDSSAGFSGEAQNIDRLLGDVQLKVQIILGRAKMTVEDILKLSNGSVVELERLAGDPLDILVNDRLVAKGEVLVLNDNFCIRVTDIVPPSERA